MEHFNSSIINKFRGLLYYLSSTRKTFEMVADEIEDCSLKTAFDGLSGESMQYANELSNQLKGLGIKYDLQHTEASNEFTEAAYQDETTVGQGDEVMLLCTKSEQHITKAYRDILNEYFPFPGLREVMTYQLNALICSFMKIRLLNTTRFS
jgi:hypothetical protein